MKALKIILYVLGGILLLLLLLGLIAPVNLEVEDSIKIEAPRDLVFEQTVHFPNFHHWSPWTHRDPDMEVTYGGNQGEVGATYRWEGIEEVGSGMQEIVSISGDTVNVALRFYEPFESEAKAYYIISKLESNPPLTRVSWGMQSTFPRPFNIVAWLGNFERKIGEEYREGLSSLKERVAEVEADEG